MKHTPGTYWAYLRKSSESEERQELSIPAQRKEVQQLATRRGITLARSPLEEAKSAKAPGRPLFGELMAAVHSGDVDGIVCWKLDRLARNPLDGGAIIWALGEGRLKEIVTVDRTYTGTADDKMLMSIMFGMATKYSDDLSANVRRGNREALERGLWPGTPKLGYIRDRDTKQLIPDPERFEKLKELWKLLLGGMAVLDVLRVAREDMMLRTPKRKKSGGHLISRSKLYEVFHDTFYAGLMVRGGESYLGSHEPMISMDEFERAQERINGKANPSTKSKEKFFCYRGLLRCGSCDSKLTARNLVKRDGRRYIYYHCWRKERRFQYCPERSIREKDLDDQVLEFLRQLTPPTHYLREVAKMARRLTDEQEAARAETKTLLEAERDKANKRLVRLRELLVDGVLTEEEYQADRERLVGGQARKDPTAAADSGEYLVPLLNAENTLNTAVSEFEDGDPRTKRLILQELTWYLVLTDKKLSIQTKKPFSLMGEWFRFPGVWAWLDYVETSLRSVS